MLQCRCPPEHLRSSAFATFMEFVIHPVGFRTNAGPSTSAHHSPTTTLTTPSMSRISRIIHKPLLLACAACVRAEKKSFTVDLFLVQLTHKSHMLHSLTCQRPPSLRIPRQICSCENAAQRGIQRVRVAFPQQGRKSNRLARTVSRPHS